MEDTSITNETIKNLAAMLDDHKAVDTVAIDVKNVNSWTDFFVISTVQSEGHQRGLVKFIHEFLDEHGIESRSSLKRPSGTGWMLIDCGNVVIHLMNSEKREFYDLEKIWYQGEMIYSAESLSKSS
jgi:ribosome-associated protein